METLLKRRLTKISFPVPCAIIGSHGLFSMESGRHANTERQGFPLTLFFPIIMLRTDSRDRHTAHKYYSDNGVSCDAKWDKVTELHSLECYNVS